MTLESGASSAPRRHWQYGTEERSGMDDRNEEEEITHGEIRMLANSGNERVDGHVHEHLNRGNETHADGSSIDTAREHPTSGSVNENVEYYGLGALLKPFTSVPEIPPLEALECVYNEEALLLQKLIFRAVKMCTNKNKIKLEEFKINSRLYGNGFMDAHEYLDSLAADIGSLETLVLTPCMLRLQPDAMKKQTLWLALRAYRATHLRAMEAQVQ